MLSIVDGTLAAFRNRPALLALTSMVRSAITDASSTISGILRQLMAAFSVNLPG